MSMYSSLFSSANTKLADPVRITRAADLLASDDGQTAGMTRQSAIVKMSSHLCGNLMRAAPRSCSDVHHHGAQDTVVYAVSGKGTIVSEGGSKRQDLSPGDWALIPAYAEHQEANAGDEEVVWVIVRGPGGTPVVENLKDWGESKRPDVGTGGGEKNQDVERRVGRA